VGRANPLKALIVLAAAAALAVFFLSGASRHLTLENFQLHRQSLVAWYETDRARAIALYMGAYVAAAGLSLPVAPLLTVSGAAIFGFWTTLVTVSFASTIGATVAFLLARYLFGEAVRARYGARLERIYEGVRREGAFYLFTLRMIPAVPFFLINIAMALTPIRAWTFYWVSQLGMLAGTAAYVNAGSQVSELRTLSGILSPGVLLSFAILGVLPLAAKRGLASLRKLRK